MGIRLDATGLFKGLAEMELKVQQGTRIYAETAGMKMINDAKANAPWTDRTGNSRQTMDTEVISKGKSMEIRLCHEKRNAILWPTIQKWSGQVLSGWVKVIR